MKKLLFCVVTLMVAMFVLVGPSGLANAEPVGSASPSPAVTQEADGATETQTAAVEESAPAPAEKQSPAAEKETDKPAPEKEQVVVQPTSAPKPESSEAQEAEEVTEPENTPAQSTEADKPAPEKEQPVATPTVTSPTESTDPVGPEDPTEPENTPAQPTEDDEPVNTGEGSASIDPLTGAVFILNTYTKGNIVVVSSGYPDVTLKPGESRLFTEIGRGLTVNLPDGGSFFVLISEPAPYAPDAELVLSQSCVAGGVVFSHDLLLDQGSQMRAIVNFENASGKIVARTKIWSGESYTLAKNLGAVKFHAMWDRNLAEEEARDTFGDVMTCGQQTGLSPVESDRNKEGLVGVKNPEGNPDVVVVVRDKDDKEIKRIPLSPGESATLQTDRCQAITLGVIVKGEADERFGKEFPAGDCKPSSSTKPAPTSSTKPSAKPTSTASAKPSKPATKPTSSAKPGLPGAGKDGKSDDFGTPRTGVTESGSPAPTAVAIFALLATAGLAVRKAHEA